MQLSNRTTLRMNSEFRKFFPDSDFVPILRDVETNRYWVNENLINLKIGGENHNIAKVVIEIIDKYAQVKKDALERFISNCLELQKVDHKQPKEVEDFIIKLLAPNVDARLFEIVSYSILKYYYHEQKIYWGYEVNNLIEDNLKLYKTGRTNANDGGIDFVMRPLGRFFQVTETLDLKKYFLDIDKIQRYPITFVIKTDDDIEEIRTKLEDNAKNLYSIKSIVDRYMACIEEIINIPLLKKRFFEALNQGYLKNILREIIVQSKVEFNYEE